MILYLFKTVRENRFIVVLHIGNVYASGIELESLQTSYNFTFLGKFK